MNKQNKTILAVDVLGILVSRAMFLGMNPIAMGFFGAAYYIKQGRFFTFVMICLGMASAMSITDLMKYIIIMAMCGIVVCMIESKVKQANIYMIATAIGISTIIVSCSTAYFYHEIEKELFLCCMEGVIAFTTTILFSKGVHWLMRCRRNCVPDNEQLISLSLMAGAIIYSLSNVKIVENNVAIAVALFLILFFAYKYGAGYGAVMGTVSGIVLSLVDHKTEMIGFMCILGIVIGMFREIGRVITVFVLVSVLIYIGMYQTTYQADVTQIQAMLLAAGIFLILPGKITRRVDVSGAGSTEHRFAKENVESITQFKLQEFSKSFSQLSKTFRNITQKRMIGEQSVLNEKIDVLASHVCSSCDKCDFCWKNCYHDTYNNFKVFLNLIEENGKAEKKLIEKEFKQRCHHMNYLLSEGTRMLEVNKLNHLWQSRLEENREAIAGQLDEVACIINDFSSDLYRTVGGADDIEDRLKIVLKANRVLVSQIVVLERKDKRKQVYMIARARKGQCIATKEVAQVLSSVLEMPMKPTEGTKNVITKKYDTFAFVEDTTFRALTASAKAIKQGEKVSGDNFSILNLENGQMILSLSDGMGTGVNANEESESVIELLEQFMEAGFKEDSAIRLINSILVLKSENQSFSTIDLSMLNLYTGVCEFVKIGAATTFIKRDNWVETISSTSMPVGVFNQVDFDQKSKKLYNGDYIIMMSDGVLDCLKDVDKEVTMQKIIMEMKTNNPQEMANYILEKALAENEHIPLDDMTVLVAGVWEK